MRYLRQGEAPSFDGIQIGLFESFILQRVTSRAADEDPAGDERTDECSEKNDANSLSVVASQKKQSHGRKGDGDQRVEHLTGTHTWIMRPIPRTNPKYQSTDDAST